MYMHIHIYIYALYFRKKGPMGWLRLKGSLKLQISFAKYHLFHRAHLQKRPTILRSQLIVATPYICANEQHATREHQHLRKRGW